MAERSVSPVGAPSSLAPYLRGESRGCPLSVHTPGTRRALDFIADPDRTEETQLTTTGAISEWVTYPGRDWERIAVEEASIDPVGWKRFLAGLDVRGVAWEGEAHGEGE